MNIHRFELMEIAGSVARAREDIARLEEKRPIDDRSHSVKLRGSSLTLGDLRKLVEIAERYTGGRV